MPAVTVLTAARDAARTLHDTIASIRAQTFGDWEYIVVDDASSDDTVRLVEAAMQDEPRLRLVRRSTAGGPYVAANEGLSSAVGRYVVRIDADDVAMPDRIERQLAFLRETRLRACASGWQSRTSNGTTPAQTRLNTRPRALKWRLAVRQGLAHSTACIEREALEEIGGYAPLPMAQDLRMWCDLARRDWLGVVPDVLTWVDRPGRLTTTAADVQERYALDVLRDHLQALDGHAWSDEEIVALRPRWTGQALSRRAAAIVRWGRLWRTDASLDGDDRRELTRLGRELRWHVTKQSLRRDGFGRTLREVVR